MEKRLVKIGEASARLGVTPQTLRKWENTGELLPERRSKTGTCYDDVSQLAGINNEGQPTVCYARVSSYDQQEEPNRQPE
jgi:predicted site-specific integrase-resolvase